MSGNRGVVALFILFVIGAVVVFVTHNKMSARITALEASAAQSAQALDAATQALDAAKAAANQAQAAAAKADAATAASNQTAQDVQAAVEKMAPMMKKR
jgi:hypothetical protein